MSAGPEPIAIATFILAAFAAGLIVWQNRLYRRSMELSIRPLLAEAIPTSDLHTDLVQFGAPGRESVVVPPGSAFLNEDGTKVSIPFRNIGAGVAAITGASTSPTSSTGSLHVSRKFVPVGEVVRVNVSRLKDPDTGEEWAMRGFTVAVHYTDSAGRQPMISRAEIREYATHGAFVESIAIFKKGKRKPLAVGRSQD